MDYLTISGQKKLLTDWEKHSPVTLDIIRLRLSAGVPPEKAVYEMRIPDPHAKTPRAGQHSLYRGVTWKKDKKRWYARIRDQFGADNGCGYHEREIDAAIAYNKAALKAFGKSARPNLR